MVQYQKGFQQGLTKYSTSTNEFQKAVNLELQQNGYQQELTVHSTFTNEYQKAVNLKLHFPTCGKIKKSHCCLIDWGRGFISSWNAIQFNCITRSVQNMPKELQLSASEFTTFSNL